VLGNISEFWRLTRELDVRALRERFTEPVHLRVVGSDHAIAQRVARLIEPDPEAGEVSMGVLGSVSRESADLVIVALDGPLDSGARRVLSELSVSETPLVVVQSSAAAGMLVLGIPDERVITLVESEADDETRQRLFSALVDAGPEVMLAAGRRHPLLREPVADYLIRDTARVNAQFAAISSIPANLPIVGGLVGDLADMLVLTKNQILLIFKLAGLYGRELELGRQLLLEVLPVVGGAFFWRGTARTLVGLLPAPIGILPKTLVAHTGTMVVGELARVYFRSGRKPPPSMARELVDDSARLAHDAFNFLRRR
jgi:uncharacterized protein (DUF697 family)